MAMLEDFSAFMLREVAKRKGFMNRRELPSEEF